VTRTPAIVAQDSSIAVAGEWAWPPMGSWLSARAIDDVEVVSAGEYRRTASIGNEPAVVQVRAQVDHAHVRVIAGAPVDLTDVVARVTRVFDLDRDLPAMHTTLGGDAWLARLLVKHAGLRVPGGWDPFELAVRAVLGQQVTIGAARHLASQLVALCGPALPECLRQTGLTRLFPNAAQVAATDLGALRMPGARRSTLTALARAAADDPCLFAPHAPLDQMVARLCEVKGIGQWTAQYIALRALRHPDAFPASDIGLLRGAATAMGSRPTAAALLRRAERWRPCRAYAAQLLWAEDGDR
jgi:3-methyladenine DNA glycosylase/8-oxoguanine DNA glycosylase